MHLQVYESDMIEIITALPAEAEGLIRELELKPKKEGTLPFRQYVSEDGVMRLTISGTGKAAAAAAVGAVLGGYAREELNRVRLVNFGSCAAVSPAEGDASGSRKLYLVNKITDADTGRTYYPDVLDNEGADALCEAQILTGSSLMDHSVAGRNALMGHYGGCQDGTDLGGTDQDGTAWDASLPDGAEPASARPLCVEPLLYDMEASAVYEAAHFFLGPHQVCFLKGVTDSGLEWSGQNSRKAGSASAFRQTFARTMGTCAARAAGVIRAFPTAAQISEEADRNAWTRQSAARLQPAGKLQTAEEAQKTAAYISAALHASVTMDHEVEQLVRYGCLAGLDVQKVFAAEAEKCRQQGLIHGEGSAGTAALFAGSPDGGGKTPLCRDRREGKILLEHFRQSLQGVS